MYMRAYLLRVQNYNFFLNYANIFTIITRKMLFFLRMSKKSAIFAAT
jgi:hypothetical protein